MRTADFRPIFKPKSRRARIAAILGIIALAWLGFSLIRARRLLDNGAKIAAQSQHFSRDYHLGDPKNAPLTVLVMGDSTAAGWGAARLEGTYPHRVARAIAARGYRVRVVNIAVGGAKLEDVRRVQLPQLNTLRPDFITLSAGANDAIHFTSEAQIAREIRLIFNSLQQSSAHLILVANTPDVALAPALPLPLSVAAGRRARRLNAVFQRILRAETRSDSKIRFVDLFRLGKLNYQRDPSLYAADLFHPSARGYKIWAEIFSAQANRAFEVPNR